MSNINKITVTTLLTLLVLHTTCIVLHPAYAQSIIPLQVSPARQELLVNPGETTSFTIRLYNFDTSPILGGIHVNDFIVKNHAKPIFIEDVNQASPKYSASRWITNNYDTISIPAQEKQSLVMNITVPADAKPGGRYLAVYFEPTSKVPSAGDLGAISQEAGSAIAPRIASLVYIRVKGPIHEEASIIRFFAPFFQEYGPITVTTSILNNGDYHINPRGILAAENMLGSSIQQSLLKEQNIFPESSSDYQTTIGEKWMVGRYKIDLTTSYGEQGKALSRSIYVWVFPWKLALVILLGLILLMLMVKYVGKTMNKRQKDLEDRIQEEKEQIDLLKEKLKTRN